MNSFDFETRLTFLDLGANIGIISILASKALGQNGKRFTFEPHPTTFDSLQLNIIQNNLSDIISENSNHQ